MGERRDIYLLLAWLICRYPLLEGKQRRSFFFFYCKFLVSTFLPGYHGELVSVLQLPTTHVTGIQHSVMLSQSACSTRSLDRSGQRMDIE